MRVVILTSDKTSWALNAWYYLTKKYWPQHPPILVGGYTQPSSPDLPFYKIGEFFDYPIARWSDGLIRFLQSIDDECFIWTMDDFWFIRQVNHEAIVTLYDHILRHKELARIDLTRDRADAGTSRVLDRIGSLDIVGTELPSMYHLSLQAGIWRREALLQYLTPGETAWETELNGTGRMNDANANVIGTLQEPMRYVIAVQKGKITLDGGYQGKDHALPQDDTEELRRLNYL